MKKTDGLVQAIMQGGMGYGDAKWIAGFVRTYISGCLPPPLCKCGDCLVCDYLKSVREALGVDL